jgi:acyl dehydratase
MKFFEDLDIGEATELGRYTFTAEEIKAFAARFDPQPFHLDEQAAATTPFGKLCASGWHTACMWMRFAAAQRFAEDDERRARGEPVAANGPSPGFRDLRWLKPVYVGDTVSFATKIIDKRPSSSRPNWGLITTRNTGVNQHGDLVLDFVSSLFVERHR